MIRFPSTPRPPPLPPPSAVASWTKEPLEPSRIDWSSVGAAVCVGFAQGKPTLSPNGYAAKAVLWRRRALSVLGICLALLLSWLVCWLLVKLHLNWLAAAFIVLGNLKVV